MDLCFNFVTFTFKVDKKKILQDLYWTIVYIHFLENKVDRINYINRYLLQNKKHKERSTGQGLNNLSLLVWFCAMQLFCNIIDANAIIIVVFRSSSFWSMLRRIPVKSVQLCILTIFLCGLFWLDILFF